MEFRRYLAAFAILFSAAASAESFVQVNFDEAPDRLIKTNYFVDVDSFKPDTSTNSTYFTYRIGDLSGGGLSTATLEIDAIASCGKFALTMLRMYSIKLGEKKLDLERFNEEEGWKQTPFYGTNYLSQSGDSVMLLEVCRRVYPELVQSMMSRPESGCLDRGTFNFVLCHLGENNRFNLRLVKARIELVGEYCGNADYLNSRLSQLLKDVELCANDKMCFLRREGGLAHGVSADASKIASWLLSSKGQQLDKDEACQTQRTVDKNAQYRKEISDRAEAERKANEAFWQCVKKQVGDIDDGVSDGATIAKVLLRRCDSQISGVVELDRGFSPKINRDDYIRDVEPGVIEVVLKARKKKR